LLERHGRNFYCGSTLLHTDKICSASINIRSATIDGLHRTMIFDAGGGITLRSKIHSEWKEMNMKMKSFFKIWNNL